MALAHFSMRLSSHYPKTTQYRTNETLFGAQTSTGWKSSWESAAARGVTQRDFCRPRTLAEARFEIGSNKKTDCNPQLR